MNEDRASRYHRLKRRAAVLSLAATASLLAVLLLTGGSRVLRDAAGGSVWGYVLLLLAIQECVALPLSWYGGWFLDRRYGLSIQPVRGWVRDHALASVMAGALSVAGAEIVYFAMRETPRWWWAASALTFAGGLALLARIAPITILPLFYRFKPLDRDTLRDRLVSLSARAGVPVLGVYEWGLGDKTRRANAALVGAGGTRRILLSDTLLADYTEDEIEIVLAHEIGHHVHRDILKGLAVEVALLLAAFVAAAIAIGRLWPTLHLGGPADVAGLPVLLLGGGAISVAATPLLNALSRRNERRADRYALELTERPASFVSAMKRLAAQNLAEARPSRASLWLFHSHPPFEQRIRAAQAFAASAGK